MKMFIKGEYVDLEKFHHFYWKDGKILFLTPHSGKYNEWKEISLSVTKEEYDSLLIKISDLFQIPILL